MIFLLLVAATAAVLAAAILYGYRRSGDPFHPIVYLGGMLAFPYVVQPLYLALTQGAALERYLGADQLDFVQLVNLAGVLAFVAGILVGGRTVTAGGSGPPALPEGSRSRFLLGGRVMALMAVATFSYGIYGVGGLQAAYGRSYGGGWVDSGYLRELVAIGLPGCLMMLVGLQERRLSPVDLAWLALALSPLVIHGALGARRGPTFMALTALGIGWCLSRHVRLRFPVVLLGGVGVGLLLLWLVANRSDVHLGGDLAGVRSVTESYALRAGPGTEFVYAAGVILDARYRDEYFWGRRYAVEFLIRPIPRDLWPSKYADASDRLGLPNLEQNLGTGGARFRETLGWRGSSGAAPGLVADAWLEFWWLSLPLLFGYGFLFGWLWCRARTVGGIHLVLSCLAASLSIYIVMQTFAAFGFRFLLLGTAALVGHLLAAGREETLPAERVLASGYRERFQAIAAERQRARQPSLGPGS